MRMRMCSCRLSGMKLHRAPVFGRGQHCSGLEPARQGTVDGPVYTSRPCPEDSSLCRDCITVSLLLEVACHFSRSMAMKRLTSGAPWKGERCCVSCRNCTRARQGSAPIRYLHTRRAAGQPSGKQWPRSNGRKDAYCRRGDSPRRERDDRDGVAGHERATGLGSPVEGAL